MKLLLAVVMFFPLFAFLIAGVIELRSDRSLAQKLGKLVPVILGLAAFVLFFNPQGRKPGDRRDVPQFLRRPKQPR